MIFRKLTLKNFGIFNGLHTINFNSQSKRPVVLITALNGSGKTTILTAIQIVLYGKLTPDIKNTKIGYKQYLQNKINNNARSEAWLELDMVLPKDGKKNIYSVKRQWKLNNNNSDIIETFCVKVDNCEDKLLSEKWLEFIEGLLPLNIMPLFFFDGERVEEMAGTQNSSTMLETGIYSLLGMDLVSKLQNDLKTYNNRYILRNKRNFPDAAILMESRENVISRQNELKKIKQEKASYKTKIEYIKGKLENAEKIFTKSGGDLYKRKLEINLKDDQINKQLTEYHEIKKQIMAKEGPLLLVKDLFTSIVRQAKKEMKGNEAKIAGKYLEQQQKDLLKLLDKDLPDEIKVKINRYFSDKKESYYKNSRHEYYLDLSHSTFAELIHLHNKILPEVSNTLKRINYKIKTLEIEKGEIIELIHSLPADDEIRPILAEIEKYKNQIEEYKAIISKIEEKEKASGFYLNEAAKKLKAIITGSKLKKINNEKNERIMQYSQLVHDYLNKFRQSVTTHYIASLEKQIKQCFIKLIHKKNFIKNIRIDSMTFQLSLRDYNEKIIIPENLSAGERQLLATAIFWALVIESGIEAPIIIDTPLGRLDSVHRKKIVNFFFPKAGKQVILLSTDQEITGTYLRFLKPHISCHYIIDNDRDALASEFRKIS